MRAEAVSAVLPLLRVAFAAAILPSTPKRSLSAGENSAASGLTRTGMTREMPRKAAMIATIPDA